MAEIVTLLQRVAQQVRRCPEPTLIQAYRDAARQFCLESRWLRRTIEPVATEADVSQYALIPGSAYADLEVVSVRTVVCNNLNGTPQSQWRINPTDPTTWNPSVQPGEPQTYAYVPESELAVFPAPDGVYELTVVACMQPVIDATVIPDDLVRKWDRQLSAGAMAYLYEIPDQPWSDPRKAGTNRIAFQAAINNAKADEQRAYNMGTVVARIPRLFGRW
jgi:hypothetical protein